MLASSAAAFDVVGELLQHSRFKAAISEAMRVAAAANKYLSDTEPWKLGRREHDADRERQATILHTALQVVDDVKTMLTPFLPHSAQQIFDALGGVGVWAAQPAIVEVEDLDDDVEGDSGFRSIPTRCSPATTTRSRPLAASPDPARARRSASRRHCSASSTRASARPDRSGRRSRDGRRGLPRWGAGDPHGSVPPGGVPAEWTEPADWTSVALPLPLPAPVVDAHTHLDAVGCHTAAQVEAELDLAASVGVAGVVTVADDLASARWAAATAAGTTGSGQRSGCTRPGRRR